MPSIPPPNVRVMVLAGPELLTRTMVRDAVGTLQGVWFGAQCHDVIHALQNGVEPVALVVHLDAVGCLNMIRRIRSHQSWGKIPIFTLAGSDAMTVVRAIQAGVRASFNAPYKGLAAPLAQAAGVSLRSISEVPGPRGKTPPRGMKRSG